jgi:hypothetical protein
MKKPNYNKTKNFARVAKAMRILNGCGGNKGTKCGVEVYYLPADSKLNEIQA